MSSASCWRCSSASSCRGSVARSSATPLEEMLQEPRRENPFFLVRLARLWSDPGDKSGGAQLREAPRKSARRSVTAPRRSSRTDAGCTRLVRTWAISGSRAGSWARAGVESLDWKRWSSPPSRARSSFSPRPPGGGFHDQENRRQRAHEAARRRVVLAKARHRFAVAHELVREGGHRPLDLRDRRWPGLGVVVEMRLDQSDRGVFRGEMELALEEEEHFPAAGALDLDHAALPLEVDRADDLRERLRWGHRHDQGCPSRLFKSIRQVIYHHSNHMRRCDRGDAAVLILGGAVRPC